MLHTCTQRMYVYTGSGLTRIVYLYIHFAYAQPKSAVAT